MTSPDEPQPTGADRVYRSGGAVAGGVLLLALGVWLGGEAVLAGEGRTPWIALAALLLVVPVVVAFTFRPAVFANDDRLRVRNPFRTVVLPWASVEGVSAGYSSEVLAGGRKYQLWAIPVSLRRRKQAARRQARDAASDVSGRTRAGTGAQGPLRAPADQHVDDLREQAERCASLPGAQGEPVIRWAYEIIAPAAVGAILLAVLLATR
ncbi:PH domain-containing protein [Streptomyces sp. GC420]|uniref:PH domain-containing protein n=1 Tax=Streptomyces sp. GC420 TaxID=2697568 RepID=UPI001414E2D3|nr:PH domain-containing protein [Streptomyces sp. GC420]NBM18739.1 PH domain-containing protein [Streptomyces sp. GC420]